ncbi:MAG: hypothetical protein IT536_13745 [Hyphomicrobiales bacterium]|nr:hypothetical protein [Hyphomicrobiales bacterium]
MPMRKISITVERDAGVDAPDRGEFTGFAGADRDQYRESLRRTAAHPSTVGGERTR